jgi:hypothetical protein
MNGPSLNGNCRMALIAACASQAIMLSAPNASHAQFYNAARPSYVNAAGTPSFQQARNNAYGYTGAGALPYAYGGAPVYPFGNPYINPIARGNGFYGFNGGGVSVNNMWRAPSGYYYPWYGVGGGFNQTVYVDTTGGQNQTVAKDPPLSSMFTDMGAYLDDSKKNNKVSENDYQSLKRRLTDIHSKERSLRIAGGGQIAEGDESEIRQNLNDFSREMVERIKI